jgi:hypothetical protein
MRLTHCSPSQAHTWFPVKAARLVRVAALLLVATATFSTAQTNDFIEIVSDRSYLAWYLQVNIHPITAEVRGIPARKLRKTWCKATEFRKELFPPDLAPGIDERGDFSFAADGYFDGSKIRQSAHLGVYETCTGDIGTFLLVLAWPANKSPKIRFVHEMQLKHQFAVLTVRPGATISVLHCMCCDHETEFKWNHAKQRFVRLPPKIF